MPSNLKTFSQDEMLTILRALKLAYCLFNKWEKDERAEKIPHVEHIGDIRGSMQQVKDLLVSLNDTEPGNEFLVDLAEFFSDVEKGT